MNGNDNRMSPEGFTANRNRQDQNGGSTQNAKPRFKIKDGNIIRINPDGTTTSRPLTDDERRRLEEARANNARQRSASVDEEAARRRADQKYLARVQSDAAEQLGVTNVSPAQRRRRDDNVRRENAERQQRRRKVRINPGAVVFVALMAVVLTVSYKQIKLNEENRDTLDRTDLVYNGQTYSDDDNEIAVETDIYLPMPEEVPIFDTVSIANDEIHNGSLILVNYENEYVERDIKLINAYEERTGDAETGRIKVSKTTTCMEKEAFDALERLVVRLKNDTGTSDLMIVSGHRTYQDQVDIYDGYVQSNGEDYAKAYVANPGYSEHQTGLACDLTFYTSEGYSVPIPDYEYGSWVPENCMYEGFVRRYPEDKVDITGISYEAWHFRYVGIPHAYAMTTLNYCLEEYLDYIKGYTAETKLLHVKEDMSLEEIEADSVSDSEISGGWLVYYVQSSDGENTDISIPYGCTDYEISGNNTDGFVVTVKLS